MPPQPVKQKQETRNLLELWLKKTSTAQEADRVGKVPTATNTAKNKAKVHKADHVVRLLEVKRMTF